MLQFKEVISKERLKLCHIIISEAGADMYNRLGFTHWYPPKTFEKYLEHSREKKVFLCYSDKKEVATFALSEVDSGYSEPIWNNIKNAFIISKLAVHPSCQNIGIGTSCLNFIEIYAYNHGKSRLLLDILDEHKELEKFYKNFGFDAIIKRKIKNKRGVTWGIQQFEKKL